MKIESVKMMRNIREQMSLDIRGMTFEEEQKYLLNQIQTFQYLIQIKPNLALQSDRPPSGFWVFHAQFRRAAAELRRYGVKKMRMRNALLVGTIGLGLFGNSRSRSLRNPLIKQLVFLQLSAH